MAIFYNFWGIVQYGSIFETNQVSYHWYWCFYLMYCFYKLQTFFWTPHLISELLQECIQFDHLFHNIQEQVANKNYLIINDVFWEESEIFAGFFKKFCELIYKTQSYRLSKCKWILDYLNNAGYEILFQTNRPLPFYSFSFLLNNFQTKKYYFLAFLNFKIIFFPLSSIEQFHALITLGSVQSEGIFTTSILKSPQVPLVKKLNNYESFCFLLLK